MMQRDYILVLVEQLGRFLARIIVLKESGRYETAFFEIDRFCRTLFGHGSHEIIIMRFDDLAGLVRDGGNNTEQWLTLAEALEHQGDMLAQKNMVAESYESLRRALLILLEASAPNGRRLIPEVSDRVDRLIGRCAQVDLPQGLQERVLVYLETGERQVEE